jgi:glycosyltransferase involved in cell wall biosynthesis
VIAASQAVREGLVNDCGVARGKIRVIHNGVDIDRLDEDRISPIFATRVPVVGSLGPIEHQRGHELFIRAAGLVASRLPDVQFVVAGEGTELPGLRKLVAGLGLDRRVTLATDFGSYADVLAAIDVVVQSSQVNVSGFSILEAMGHGRPVIAFNTGTACEIVEDGKTGLLIPKGDVDALAGAIVRLLDDRDTAARMGAAARRAVAERFDARTLAEATLAYYEDLVSGG